MTTQEKRHAAFDRRVALMRERKERDRLAVRCSCGGAATVVSPLADARRVYRCIRCGKVSG